MLDQRAGEHGGEPVSALARAGNYLYDVAFLPAIEDNALIAREWIKTQQMTAAQKIKHAEEKHKMGLKAKADAAKKTPPKKEKK